MKYIKRKYMKTKRENYNGTTPTTSVRKKMLIMLKFDIDFV
jgi:hypothetical protein